MYRSVLAWAPLLLLIAGLCIPEAYWCSSINQGGKELGCGYDYAGPLVKTTVVLLYLESCAFIATAWHATQRRLSTWGARRVSSIVHTDWIDGPGKASIRLQRRTMIRR
jgi:hypothetical protein